MITPPCWRSSSLVITTPGWGSSYLVITPPGWRSKFLRHRAIHAEMKAEIPFPFYRDSISIFQTDKDGGPGEARWKVNYSPSTRK